MSTLKEQVDFGLIRYANCWEDADILLDALAMQQGCSILCIASAGDNALSLLTTAPASVHAIDLSLPQLYLTELKQIAFDRLTHGELLKLLGVINNDESRKLYGHISKHLSTAAKSYWDEQTNTIADGIVHAGKFEHYFSMFRKYVLPMAHSKNRIQELLAEKPQDAQIEYYNKRWNTWRWRLLMSVFFSKRIMGKYGRDPQFLKHVAIPVSQYIRQKAERHLQTGLCQENHMLRMIFTGSFGTTLPHYLRRENFDGIKQHISKLSIRQADADTAVRQNSYDAYCFSNIFEYMSHEDFKYLVDSWGAYMPAGARLAYWNLMVPRSFAQVSTGMFGNSVDSDKYAARDKGFFYSRFLAEHKL